MRLADLMAYLPGARVTGLLSASHLEQEVSRIVYNSRQAAPGSLFFALKGSHADGHDFVDDAKQRGALAVVAEREIGIDMPVIVVPDTRKALAAVSNAFWGKPCDRICMIGITGTNGKSTTAGLVKRIMECAGYSSGTIGTLGAQWGGRKIDLGLTTPEAPDICRILNDMRHDGITHCAMEVSSHGIAMQRIAGCDFDAGVFINLSRDHLDFHGDMESYASVKAAFFTKYLPRGEKDSCAVINTGDPFGKELAGKIDNIRLIRVGAGPDVDISIDEIRSGPDGLTGILRIFSRSFSFRSPLVGRFNLENIACAAGVAAALGVEAGAILEGLASFSSLPGRMERVDDSRGRNIFVDYSHTPMALKLALMAAREVTPPGNRLISVFGCGGDRDKEKRPEMGRVAGDLSDIVVVTDDNPRTEDPAAIIEDILLGLRKSMAPFAGSDPANGQGYVVIRDRAEAINFALAAACKDDTVIVCGKGHEDYQIIGTMKVHFDDREVIREILAGGAG